MSAMPKKILVVEDDPEIRASLEELLRSERYAVEGAADARVALACLQSATVLPQLIVLDYQLPGMDGAGFRQAQESDARLAAIPVFLLTADDYPEVKRLKIGAKAFMKKPFDVKKFLAVVEDCLR